MKISVVIPAYNEEHYIVNCIKSVLLAIEQSCYIKSEIIVVAVKGDDATVNKILEYFSPEIIKVLLADHKCRAKQMNIGAEVANGDILMFLHADTVIPQNSFNLIEHQFKTNYDKKIVSFSLCIDSPNFYFRIIEFFTSIRLFFSNIPYGDQVIIVSKNLFSSMGAFDDVTELEDIIFIRKALKYGVTVKILDEKVKTSARSWYKNGFIRQTLNNRIAIIKFILGDIFGKVKKIKKD